MTLWEGDHPPGEALSALADGELEEAAAVWEHTATCGGCARDLAWLSDLRSRVRAMPVPEPPPGFEEALIDRVARADLGPVGRRPIPAGLARRRRAAATAAAAVAVAAATVATLVVHEPSTTPPVGRMVESHLTSSGDGDPSRLAPAAVPAAFGR